MENNFIKIVPPEGQEIDKENSTFEEIRFKPIEKKLPSKWEELGSISGYYVNTDSLLVNIGSNIRVYKGNKNLFATKAQANAALALAQLSQLMKVYNDGWEPNRSCVDGRIKYSICFYNNELITEDTWRSSYFLAFKTKELRDKFLKNFRDLIIQARPLL